MNLLRNVHNDATADTIISILEKLGIQQDKMVLAKQYFDFSKPADHSLLNGLERTALKYDSIGYQNEELFTEMSMMPPDLSFEVSDTLYAKSVSEVPLRYFSEIVYQIEQICKKAKKEEQTAKADLIT